MQQWIHEWPVEEQPLVTINTMRRLSWGLLIENFWCDQTNGMLLISQIYQVFALFRTHCGPLRFQHTCSHITAQHWIAQRNATSPYTVFRKQVAYQSCPQDSNLPGWKPTTDVQLSFLKCNKVKGHIRKHVAYTAVNLWPRLRCLFASGPPWLRTPTPRLYLL